MIQSGLVGDQEDCGALGMIDCLPKPYGSEELKQRIEAIAERKAPSSDQTVKADNAGPKAKSESDRRGATTRASATWTAWS